MTTVAMASRPLGVKRWSVAMPTPAAEEGGSRVQTNGASDPGTPATACADIAVEDWDVLFGAIKARLRHLALDTPGSVLHLHARNTSTRLQGSILECVSALDQLHTTLRHELSRRHLEDVTGQDAGNGLAWVWADSSCIGLDPCSGWSACCASEVKTTSQD
jgi:hypothetical protein